MKKLSYSVSDITLIAVLTACNSVLELSVGTLLHAVGFSLKGSVMVGLNLLVYVLLFARLRRFGAVTMCGAATAFVNFAVTGGFKLFALYCIVLEALAIDAILSACGINRKSTCIAGTAAGILAFLCGLLNGVVFMGGDFSLICRRLSQLGAAGEYSLAAVLLFVVLSRTAIGVVFGLLSLEVLRIFEPILKKFSFKRG